MRWAPLVIRHQGLFFPSADLQAARLYLDQPFALRISDYGIKGVELGTRRLGERLDAPVVAESRTVKRHFADSKPFGFLGDTLAHGNCCADIAAIGNILAHIDFDGGGARLLDDPDTHGRFTVNAEE